MELLEVMNRCLRGSSYPAVNSDDDPDEAAALTNEVIKSVRKRVLSGGFAFNTDRINLAVDVNGRVPVSNAYLKMEVPYRRISARKDGTDRFLWDNQAGEWWSDPITVTVVTDIENIPDIPFLFAEWIAAESADRFRAESKGETTATLRQARNSARANAINSLEHASIFTRNRNAIASPSRSTAAWLILGAQ